MKVIGIILLVLIVPILIECFVILYRWIWLDFRSDIYMKQFSKEMKQKLDNAANQKVGETLQKVLKEADSEMPPHDNQK